MIATIHFTVAANASGFLTLSFSDVKAISNNQLPLAVNPQSGSIFTSINEVLANPYFTLYPNPVHEYLNIDVRNNVEIKFEIINTLGQVVAEKVPTEKRINISGIPAGIYLLRGRPNNSGKIFEEKFVKE